MADDAGRAPLPPPPRPMSERLEQLAKLKEQALHAGPEASVRRQHERGKLTARERIDLLLDPGTFVELDMLARHRAHGFGIEANRPTLNALVQYLHEQALIAAPIKVDDLFVPTDGGN